MMKSKLKMLGAVLAIASLSACSSMNSTYKIKSEKGNVVDKVPAWYMACLLYTSPSPRDS